MNDAEVRKAQILDLAKEIGNMADEDLGARARDIGAAARTITKLAEPSALDDEPVRLSIYFAPDRPRGSIGDRVLLPDGRQLRGVSEIVVKDSAESLREATITIRDISIFGAPVPEAE